MKNFYPLLVTILLFAMSTNAYAQPQKGQFINASIGLGLAAPYDEADVTGDGFYAQAEYVWAPKRWFGIRPYVGVVTASGESDENGFYKSRIKSNAALLGAKVRAAAPIPYVAPFIEAGVGMSLGSFETRTQFTDIEKSGMVMHIPFSLGLAIGRRHNYEIKFTYYYHDTAKQLSGAAAIGVSFPIGNGEE